MYFILFQGVEFICFHSVIVVTKPIANNTEYELTNDIINAKDVSLIISGWSSKFIKPMIKNIVLIPTLKSDKNNAGETVTNMS